jgi:hypothetical protein
VLVVLRNQLPIERDRLAILALRVRVLADFALHFAQISVPVRCIKAGTEPEALERGQASSQQRHGVLIVAALIDAEALVGGCERRVQVGRDLGLTGELGGQSLAGPIQEIGHADVAPVTGRIGGGQHVLKEPVDLFRLARLDVRARRR